MPGQIDSMYILIYNYEAVKYCVDTQKNQGDTAYGQRR
jgi:hypothetical protein